jgi:hypothetical protein
VRADRERRWWVVLLVWLAGVVLSWAVFLGLLWAWWALFA